MEVYVDDQKVVYITDPSDKTKIKVEIRKGAKTLRVTKAGSTAATRCWRRCWPIRTHVTDEGLATIAVFARSAPKLNSLFLNRTLVTDEGLKHLNGVELHKLELSGTNISDAGLEHLSSNDSLRTSDGSTYAASRIQRQAT